MRTVLRIMLGHSRAGIMLCAACRYLEVTAMAKETKQYDDLVRFLMMVRDKIKDPKVDTEIAIAYAMTGKLGELEAFITSATPPRPSGLRRSDALRLYIRVATVRGPRSDPSG